MLPRFDDIRINAKKLNEEADTKFEKNKKKAFTLYTKAVTQILSIPEKERTNADWHHLALYQNNAGIACQDPQQELTWHEATVKSLLSIPEKERVHNDWHNLALYQNNAGIACQDPQQELKWYVAAIKSLLSIPEKERTLDDWRNLAQYQNNAGVRCMRLSQWKRAQSYFYSALDTLNNAINNELIASIYSDLQSMETQYSINKQLYSFAHDVFLGKNQSEVETQFLQLHLAVSNSVDSQSNSSRRGLLQLMQLIESSINASHYPNEDVKKWLSNKDNHERFKISLQEIKDANQPLSLLKAIDQAPTFSVAVASKLLVQDERISALEAEIHSLKKENKQLKKLSFFQPKNSSQHQDQTVQEALSGQNMEKPSEKNNASLSFNH